MTVHPDRIAIPRSRRAAPARRMIVHMKRWIVAVGVAVLLVGESWLIATESPLLQYQGAVLWIAIPSFVVIRVVQISRRPPSSSSSRTIRPGVQGLGEVQDMYLGRKPVPPVTYSSTEGVVAEVVDTRADPLNAAVWTVGPRMSQALGSEDP
jgi:hypothetical protein